MKANHSNCSLDVCSALAWRLVGCGHKTERAAAPPLPTATVRAQTVESKKRIATEEVVGTVRAKLRSVIEAKVSGKIEQMLVVPGQQVKAGELLAVIDAREVQARYDQALALRQQAEADLKRLTSLLEQKILSQAEFDNAQAKARVAVAGVTEAETMLELHQSHRAVRRRHHPQARRCGRPRHARQAAAGHGRFPRAPARSRRARSRRRQTHARRQTSRAHRRAGNRTRRRRSAKSLPPPIPAAARFS